MRTSGNSPHLPAKIWEFWELCPCNNVGIFKVNGILYLHVVVLPKLQESGKQSEVPSSCQVMQK